MSDATNRRKFLKGTAIAGAAAAGTLAAPSIANAAPVTLKLQAAWGGGIFLENAKSYVDRVHAMAGKDLKIDLLAVNAVVKTVRCRMRFTAAFWMPVTMCRPIGTRSQRQPHCSAQAPALAGHHRKCSAGATMAAAWSYLTS